MPWNSIFHGYENFCSAQIALLCFSGFFTGNHSHNVAAPSNALEHQISAAIERTEGCSVQHQAASAPHPEVGFPSVKLGAVDLCGLQVAFGPGDQALQFHLSYHTMTSPGPCQGVLTPGLALVPTPLLHLTLLQATKRLSPWPHTRLPWARRTGQMHQPQHPRQRKTGVCGLGVLSVRCACRPTSLLCHAPRVLSLTHAVAPKDPGTQMPLVASWCHTVPPWRPSGAAGRTT